MNITQRQFMPQSFAVKNAPMIAAALFFFFCISLQFSAGAQTTYSSVSDSMTASQPAMKQPAEKISSWWVGVAGGANYNMYHGYTSAVNVDVNANPAFHRGNGAGGYAAGVLIWHRDTALFGLMLQQGLDSRRAIFKRSGTELETRISYFTIEPSIMIMPFKKRIYFYIGPRLGLLWHTGFSVRIPGQEEYPQKNVNPRAYVKNLDKVTGSIQGGIGYDIRFSDKSRAHAIVLSPFITYLPGLNINLRTIEDLELNTVRAGIILKVAVKSHYK